MSTPSLPKSIRIAGFDIAVEELTTSAALSDDIYGDFSSGQQRIRVLPNRATKWNVMDTLIHEISHAIYWAYEIHDEDKEERVVGTMGTAWTQIYRDNPDLVRFISETTTPPEQISYIDDPGAILRAFREQAGLN